MMGERLENRAYQAQLAQYAEETMNWNAIDGKTFFITGASGMIGTFFVDILMWRNKKRDAQIKVIASCRKKSDRFAVYAPDRLFAFYEHDVNEPFTEKIAADYIVHAASNTHPLQYAGDPIGTVTANILGTKNILDLAAGQPGSRVIFLSSVEIYGEACGGQSNFDEKAMGYLDCNTLRAGYPESKRAGEALCQAYIAAKGLDIVIARLCRVYGPTMLPTDSKALAQFIKNAVLGENIVLKSEGKQRFSYLYAGDAAFAILYLLQSGGCGEAYNVAGSDVTLRELAQMLAKNTDTGVCYCLPTSAEQAGYSRVQHAVLNTGKIQRLGWHARYDLREGLVETVAILQQLGAIHAVPDEPVRH